jgi:Uma2 family endonuclease
MRATGHHRVYTARGLAVVGDPGFVLARGPDVVRAPDVAFVRRERIAAGLPTGFFEDAPDLACEVVSPDDTRPELEAKARQFLDAGTLEVWVIDPIRKTARSYRADGGRTLGAGETLSCLELLGDFTLAPGDLWP